MQIEPRSCTATHILDDISWQHVSNTNWAQELHSHSLPGWHFMAACQQYKLSPGAAQPLTSWMRWIICVVNLTFSMWLAYYLLHIMFTICLPITLKFLLFPPCHSYNQCIVKHVWYHTHILNSQVKPCHQHWVMILTSWNVCCHSLPCLRQKWTLT